MKFRILCVAVVGVLMGGLFQAQTCQAQIKPVLFPGLNSQSIIQGMPITLNLKNPANEKVKGTLVWADANSFVVRTQSEGKPVVVKKDNVDNMNDIGAIKPVSIPEPEILAVSIQNGPNQYNEYFSGRSPQLGGQYLSPTEREMLDKLARAEKALGTAQAALDETRQMLNNALTLENQKIQAQTAYYQNSRLYALGFRTPPIVNQTAFGYNGYGLGSGYGGYGYGGRYAMGGVGSYLAGGYAYPYGGGMGYGGGWNGPAVAQQMRNPVIGELPGTSAEDTLKVAQGNAKETGDMMVQARKDYEQVRGLALYSADGRLVALKTWE